MVKTKKNTGKNVPIIDLLSHYQASKKEVDLAVQKVLQSGWYVLGKELENFESNFAKYIGVSYAVGVASGTDALTLSLKALGLTSQDGVIIPANVYPTAFGVALAGVKVQLADVDPNTLNISVETLEKAMDKNTKALVVVHLYGNPVEMDKILKFARKNKLWVIEDCAQAIGALYKNKKVGSFADLGCFSFYPTKNLGAYGDGGMIVTKNKSLFNKLKLLRMYGEESRYRSVLVGHNSRLDELQASILNTLLKKVDNWNKQRQKLADLYKKSLADLPLQIIKSSDSSQGCYHLFVIKTNYRDKLMQFLKLNHIGTGIHYPYPIHLTPSFKSLGYKKGELPIAEAASREILSLPIYPELTTEQVLFVISKIREFFQNSS